MGGGASKTAEAAVDASKSAWTKEEQEANEKAEECQRYASDYITEHMYYRIPIKCGKKSVDPKSPIFIEVDPEVLEDQDNKMDDKTRHSIPSGVVVSGKGAITVEFVYTGITYTLDVEEIRKSKKKVEDYLANPYKPTPPFLSHATETTLHLRWVLPESPGLSKEIELEYTQDFSVLNDPPEYPKTIAEESKSPASSPGKAKKNPKWIPLVSKTWDMTTFMFHNFDDLRPGFRCVVRMRYRDFIGWSVWSNPSAIISTLAGPPSVPAAPEVVLAAYDSIKLRWSPTADNGSPVVEYILRGRSAGDTEFDILYNEGVDLSFLVMHLQPEFPYSFEVAARNGIGQSDWSRMTTVMTPAKLRIREDMEARQMAGYNCKEAWRELWDPKTEQNFYFNQLTGSRQLDIPAVLREDIEAEKKGSDKATGKGTEEAGSKAALKKEEVKFRTKRFRLVRALHKQKMQLEDRTPAVSQYPSPTRGGGGGGRGRGGAGAFGSPTAAIAGGGGNGSRGGPHAPRQSPVPGARPRLNSRDDASSIHMLHSVQGLLPTIVTGSDQARNEIFTLELSRLTLLSDAYSQFQTASQLDMFRRLKVKFSGEAGIDSGGLTKEMFLLLSKEIVVYAGPVHRRWLKGITSDGQLYFTNPKDVNPEAAPAVQRRNSLNKVVWHADGSSSSKIGQFQPESAQRDAPAVSKVPEVLPLAHLSTEASSKVFESINLKHGLFAHFMGRFIGKALYDRQMIDIPLSPLLLKHMLGAATGNDDKNNNVGTNIAKSKDSNVEVTNEKEKEKEELLLQLEDLRLVDTAAYSSLKWMLNNDITDILFETFTAVVNGKEIPLCRDGDKRDVTEENKHEYVKLIVEWKTVYSVSELLHPFLAGFHEIAPVSVLKECQLTANELDLILNGKPVIDIDEIRAYCIFQGARSAAGLEEANGAQEIKWDDSHEQVEWLWRILRSCDDETRRLYLKFVTGTSRVPLDGYDPPFNLTEGIDMDIDSLPRAHTCFNQLVLPEYSSYEVMKEKILFAISNTEGFELS